MIYPQTQGTKTVFVTGISGATLKMSNQLRLDGADDCNKYIFVKKGSGRCMINGATHGFSTNTVIYIPNSCPHHVDLGVNTQAIVIAIPTDVEFNLPSDAIIQSMISTNDISTMAQMFDAALHEYNSKNPASDMAIYSYTGLISVNVTRLLAQQETGKKSAAHRLMHSFAHLVEEQFFSGNGLEHYARVLGVTSTHLTRVCQQLNSQSASHFIQDRIISEARRLLLVSDVKIQDIAQDLGFTSAAYFSRFFTTRLGISPKEFRKSRETTGFDINLEVQHSVFAA